MNYILHRILLQITNLYKTIYKIGFAKLLTFLGLAKFIFILMVKMMVVKGTMMRILVKVMVYVFMMVVIKGEIKEGEAGRARPWLGLGCW